MWLCLRQRRRRRALGIHWHRPRRSNRGYNGLGRQRGCSRAYQWERRRGYSRKRRRVDGWRREGWWWYHGRGRGSRWHDWNSGTWRCDGNSRNWRSRWWRRGRWGREWLCGWLCAVLLPAARAGPGHERRANVAGGYRLGQVSERCHSPSCCGGGVSVAPTVGINGVFSVVPIRRGLCPAPPGRLRSGAPTGRLLRVFLRFLREGCGLRRREHLSLRRTGRGNLCPGNLYERCGLPCRLFVRQLIFVLRWRPVGVCLSKRG